MESLGNNHAFASFWQETLAGYNLAPFPAAALPTSQLVASATLQLEHDISLLVPEHGRNLPTVLIRAAWALVLGRMANTRDVVLGVPVRNDHPSIEIMNGKVTPAATTLAPVRVAWDSSWTVRALLDAIHRHAKDVASFEKAGLDAIAALSPDCQQASELQTILIVQSARAALSQPSLDGWTGRAIVLHMLLDEDRLIAKAHFDPNAIEAWEMRKALERFEHVLQQLVSQSGSADSPENLLSEIDMMTKEDLQTAWEWNETVLPSVGRCVHTIIEEHTLYQPSATAVCAWDGELTYRELDRVSAILAHHLINAGVVHGTLVPLCFEKSKWTIVTLLGVLKAGGAFVLLDPSLPEERLRSIIEQTRPNILLCSAATRTLSESLTPAILVVDAELFAKPIDQLHRPAVVSPDSVMYVVFTSGSTGTPKGAMISHRNFASAMEYQLQYYGVDGLSRMYDFSSYSFIASIGNMFIALTAGGCICIPSEQDKQNRLGKSIASLRANIIHLTPSAARLITPESVPEVQLIIFSGEGLHVEDVRLWWGRVRVLNVFGLSECAPRSALNINATTPEEATRIGRGVGQITWVVDPDNHNRLAPVGCVGELVLEGPLVGLGYLNEPERTAQSFIREPPWLRDGHASRFPGRKGRLYKTGDLVRYDEQGNLSYISRKDSMVKVRGQRVELGEVEYRIKESNAGIEHATVDIIAPQGDSSRPILAAFLQFRKETPESSSLDDLHVAEIYSPTSDLEAHLSRHLPQFMTPSIFFTMKELPLTATGKKDRRRMRAIGGQFSLQRLAEMRVAARGPKRKPEGHAEVQIQTLWSHALDIEPSYIGLDDNFLQLGGDSIGAMKLVSEAREIGIGLTVADILGSPTLEALVSKAHHLDAAQEIAPFELLPQSDVPDVLDHIHRTYCVPVDSIEDVYPCTPLQQGIFLLSLSQKEYITQRVLSLNRDIDMGLFRRTWMSIAKRTELLRTRFVTDDGGNFLQMVVKEDTQFQQVSNLQEYLRVDKESPMSMGQPLARYALVMDSAGVCTDFVWTVHHGIYDGWSIRLIMDAANKEYRNQRQDHQPKFNSFIKYINGQERHKSEAYWRSYLADFDGTMFPALPPSLTQPSIDSRLKLEFPAPKGKAQTATISTLLRAAWALVVGRYLEAQDVVFGTPVSGRNAPVAEVDRMPAPIIATVPMRAKWEGNCTVANFLKMLQEQALSMIPFEQTGLHNIAKISNASRRACGFQTLLLIQPQVAPIEETMGTWVVDEYQQLNTYALMLEIKLTGDTITTHAGFDSRVAESWVVKGLLEQLHTVLVQLCSAEPAKSISDIEFVTRQDLETVWKWNNTVPIAIERCVHDMVEKRAHISRELPAVCAWDGKLNYGELQDLSTELTWKLLDLGLRPGCLVPLCFEKSVWTVVTLLALCKAGCAFILLDQSLPEQRLHGIIEQVNPSVVLSSFACQPLSTRLFHNIIVISSDFIKEPSKTPRGLLTQVNPESTLYVVFTSGSTGKPKGTVLSHSNLASAISYQMEQYNYGNDSRVFEFASYSFDMAVFVIFFTLASGSCVCVPNEDDRRSNLAKSINDLRADTLVLTPSVSRALSPDDVPQVKSIMWSGEELHVADVEPWWRKKKIRLINGYGPAECTPITTINANANTPERLTRLGKGIGVATWVVDPNDHNSLAPVGYMGELLLEGPLVGRGYLGDPERTSAAFVTDPPWLLKGSREYPGRQGNLYKTGDLVKYSQDGVPVFLGRKDTQVKIRGQRVELGEVEHHLLYLMPDIKQLAAEIIRTDTNPLLVAFVQLDRTIADSERDAPKIQTLTTEVEQKLRQSLPTYMVPAFLISIAKLPMTATGKVDRKQLKAIGQSFSSRQITELRTAGEDSKRQPTTSTERQIHQIWRRVLNMEGPTIGLDDSFIQLGGDSITAMQVSSLARAQSIDISSTDILRLKTIASVAEKVNDTKPVAGLSSSVSKPSDNRPFQLSPMQNLYVQVQADPTLCNDQTFFLKLNRRVTKPELHAAIHHIVERHGILRARFSQTDGGYWQQRISTDVAGSFDLHFQDPTDEDIPAAISHCRSRLDIVRGPLVSGLLFDQNPQALCISIHHLVVDFVSWRVILGELEALLISGVILTPPPLDFRRWVELQAEYASECLGDAPEATSHDTEAYLQYWGMATSENLALDTMTETFSIDETTTSALLGPCNSAFTTRPVHLMIAALLHSFCASFPARRHPLILNEGHGREPWDDGIDISTTVGWFTTMSAIQILSDTGTSLVDTIRLTKDCMRSFSQNGWTDFTSRFANPLKAEHFIERQLPAEILFNYAGLYQQLERNDGLFEKLALPGRSEPPSRRQVRRFSLFDIGARVENGRITISVSFHRDMSHHQEIRLWVQNYKSDLMKMSTELLQLQSRWTLSDFPLAFASYDELHYFENTQLKTLGVKSEDVEDIFPCSPLQEGILASKVRDSRNYHARFTMCLSIGEDKPPLDVERLERSWKAVAQKHALLRSLVVRKRCSLHRSKLVVLTSPAPPFSCHDVELKAPLAGSREKLCAPFQQDKLQYQLAVYRVSAREAHLRLDISHAIIDGFSMQILWNDLKTSYNDGHSLAGDFKDFVLLLQNQPQDLSLQFWAKYLADIEPCLAPASASTESRFADFKSVAVPVSRYVEVRDFCQRYEVTTATLIQVAWALVLGSLTGSNTPCFGNVYSGRDLPITHVNNIFGPLIGMAPCRVVLDESMSLLNILETAQSEYVDSLPYQHFPLKSIHKALGLKSSTLFNTIINFQRTVHKEDESRGAFSLQYLDVFDPNEYDVTVRVSHGAAGLTFKLCFRPDFLSLEEMDRLALSFGSTIEKIIMNPLALVKDV